MRPWRAETDEGAFGFNEELDNDDILALGEYVAAIEGDMSQDNRTCAEVRQHLDDFQKARGGLSGRAPGHVSVWQKRDSWSTMDVCGSHSWRLGDLQCWVWTSCEPQKPV